MLQSPRQLTCAPISSKVGSDGKNIPALFASAHHSVGMRQNTRYILWCAPDSAAYVVFRIVNALAASRVLDTMAEAYQIIYDQLLAHGDGVMPAGTFERYPSDQGLLISIWNANNHQVTWGVAQAALEALGDYMEQYGYGSVIFHIYDGPNQVGRGSILPER